MSVVLNWFLKLYPPLRNIPYLLDGLENLLTLIPQDQIAATMKIPYSAEKVIVWRWHGSPMARWAALATQQAVSGTAAEIRRAYRLARWIDEPVAGVPRHRPSLQILLAAWSTEQDDESLAVTDNTTIAAPGPSLSTCRHPLRCSRPPCRPARGYADTRAASGENRPDPPAGSEAPLSGRGGRSPGSARCTRSWGSAERAGRRRRSRTPPGVTRARRSGRARAPVADEQYATEPRTKQREGRIAILARGSSSRRTPNFRIPNGSAPEKPALATVRVSNLSAFRWRNIGTAT